MVAYYKKLINKQILYQSENLINFILVIFWINKWLMMVPIGTYKFYCTIPKYILEVYLLILFYDYFLRFIKIKPHIIISLLKFNYMNAFRKFYVHLLVSIALFSVFFRLIACKTQIEFIEYIVLMTMTRHQTTFLCAFETRSAGK